MNPRRALGLIPPLAGLCLALVAGSARADHYDGLLAPMQACADQLDTSLPPERQEPAMGCMHNYARVAAGLRMVEGHTRLMASADAKSADILRCESFGHHACGRSPLYHIGRVGYLATGCWGASENIAEGSGGRAATVRSLMSGWLHSDVHRENILDPRPTHLGLGLRQADDGRHVWTAHFGWHC